MVVEIISALAKGSAFFCVTFTVFILLLLLALGGFMRLENWLDRKGRKQ